MHAKLTRKFLTAAIAIASLLALPITTVAAQETLIPGVTFDPAVLTAKPNDQLVVDVLANHATSGNVVHLELTADGNAQFSIINEANGFLAVDKQITATSIKVDLAKTDGNFTEGEVVAQLVFNVTSEGTAVVSVGSGTMFGDQSASQSSLEVTVSGGAATVDTPATPAATSTSSTNDIIIMVGIAVGAAILLLLLVLWIKMIRKSSAKGPTWV